MTKIRVDFRLVEVGFELWGLGEHLEVLQDQLNSWKNQDRIRTYAKLKEQGSHADEGEVQLALQEHWQRVEHSLPRLLLGSYLAALWGVFEAGLVDIAEHLRIQARGDLRLNDMRGKDFLDRAQKYFHHVLDVPLTRDQKTEEWLDSLGQVRDAFAHANGRLSAIRQDRRPALESIVSRKCGIDVSMGFLVPSIEFVKAAYEAVEKTIRPLIDRVRAG